LGNSHEDIPHTKFFGGDFPQNQWQDQEKPACPQQGDKTRPKNGGFEELIDHDKKALLMQNLKRAEILKQKLPTVSGNHPVPFGKESDRPQTLAPDNRKGPS
jgi:hypothetical protein